VNAVKQVFNEDRRLAILRFLSEDRGYALNTSVLQAALCAIGHCLSRDEVDTHAAWLSEQGLVDVDPMGPVTVVRLTPRGADVAAGHATQPGVKRPMPR